MNKIKMGLSVLLIGLFACTSGNKNVPENTIYRGVVAKIKTLDPGQASDLYSATMLSFVYEGLLQYHHLLRPFKLIPALAEEMPKITEKGKVYTFKIKKGVLFQDDLSFKSTNGKGRELTAHDFIYSWKRLADAKLTS